MNEHGKCHGRHGGHGPSSFWIADPEKIFRSLSLKTGDCFVDLGCGPGEYSLEALNYIGSSGKIFAGDMSQKMINNFSSQIKQAGHKNIETMVVDITQPLPLEDNIADVCFLSMVLHIYGLNQVSRLVFQEVRRILKPDGRIAIHECKKEHFPFGPPISMRISPEETEEFAKNNEFSVLTYTDLGCNYMIQLKPD